MVFHMMLFSRLFNILSKTKMRYSRVRNSGLGHWLWWALFRNSLAIKSSPPYCTQTLANTHKMNLVYKSIPLDYLHLHSKIAYELVSKAITPLKHVPTCPGPRMSRAVGHVMKVGVIKKCKVDP